MKPPKIATRVARQLGESIDRGLFPPGSRLPGERDLAERFLVSRSTIRAVLTELEGDGRVIRSAQRGWFVPSPTVGEPPSTLQSFTEMAGLRGHTATAEVLDQSRRSVTLDEAQRLHVPPGAPALSLARLRGMDSTPICVDTNVIPLAIAEPLLTADLTDRSLYEELERLCSVSIHRSAYSVQAEAATPDLATRLAVPVGSPVLVGREIAYDRAGTPVLLGHNTYRGDAYRFEADLYRVG